MRRLALISGALLVLLTVGSSAALAGDAAETQVIRTTIPVTWLGFVPCVAPEGELVQLSGIEQIVFVLTRDATGATHSVTQVTFQGVSGIGLTSGLEYQVTNTSSFVANTDASGPPPWAITGHLVARFVSKGSASDFTMSAMFHVTVTPDLEVRSSIDETSSSCS
jgi:hypothetical protein